MYLIILTKQKKDFFNSLLISDLPAKFNSAKLTPQWYSTHDTQILIHYCTEWGGGGVVVSVLNFIMLFPYVTLALPTQVYKCVPTTYRGNPVMD